MKKIVFTCIALALALNFSCKDTAREKLEDEMETHADKIEEHAENVEEASEYVEEGFVDLEEAIENFREALETIEDEEERKIVRERIIKIMDEIDLKNESL